MPKKIGGGYHQENYDERTGRYCKSNRSILDEYLLDFDSIDFKNIIWREKKNGEKLVQVLKAKHFNKMVDPRKVDYLMAFRQKNDKSSFLKTKLGYSKEQLLIDILKNTDFTRMMYSDATKYGVKIIACTTLKSQYNGKEYYATSVWQFSNSKNARFITLYPGGEKIWDLIYMKK